MASPVGGVSAHVSENDGAVVLTGGRVPCNVAVDQPDAWVVGSEGDGDVARLGQQDDVAAGRVVEVEVGETYGYG